MRQSWSGVPTSAAHQVVITGVRSRTHLLYQASYLRRLLDEHPGGVEVGYVGGGRMLGAARLPTDEVAAFLPDDERLSLRFLQPDDDWLAGRDASELTYLAVGAPGVKPWLRLRAGGLRRRLSVVVTDEGLGSYGDHRDRSAAWRRQGANPVWAGVRAAGVGAASRWLTTRRWPTYRRTADGWRVEEIVRAEFVRRVERHAPSAPEGREARTHVVLLTQPWVEIGVLSAAEQLAHCEQVARAAGEVGLGLVIRPHPAENPTRYRGWDVIERAHRQPAELDARMVDAAAVVGGLTTALVNLSALFGVPVLRHAPDPVRHLDAAMSPRQASLVEQFCGPAVPDADLTRRLAQITDCRGTP